MAVEMEPGDLVQFDVRARGGATCGMASNPRLVATSMNIPRWRTPDLKAGSEANGQIKVKPQENGRERTARSWCSIPKPARSGIHAADVRAKRQAV